MVREGRIIMASGRNWKLIVGTIIATCLSGATVIYSPAVASVQSTFNVAPDVLSSMLSLAAIANLVGALVAGLLQRFIAQRVVIILAAALALVGAAPLFISNSFTVVYVALMTCNVGMGIMGATSQSYISLHFDGDQRGEVMAWRTSAQGLSNVALSAGAGVLTAITWYYCFGLYLVFAVSLLAAVILLPSEPPFHKEEKKAEKAAGAPVNVQEHGRKLTSWTTIMFLLLITATTFLECGIYNYISIHAEANNLGGSVAAGMTISAYQAGLIVSGILAPFVFKMAKQRTLIVAYTLDLIGYVLIFIAPTAIVLFIGAFLCGMTYGIATTRIGVLVAESVRPSQIPTVFSLFQVFGAGGYIVGAPIFSAITGMMPGLMSSNVYLIGIVFAACIIAVVLFTGIERRAVLPVANAAEAA